MDLGVYVNDLQRRLLEAAESTDEPTRAAAERLASGLDAATRIVLLDAVSTAAADITSHLAPGSVDVRLRGRDVEFVVDLPDADDAEPDRSIPAADLDDASTSRTTLRLPDALKARVDEAAAADGMSVNAWLVRAIAAALEPKNRRASQRSVRTATGESFAGWVR